MSVQGSTLETGPNRSLASFIAEEYDYEVVHRGGGWSRSNRTQTLTAYLSILASRRPWSRQGSLLRDAAHLRSVLDSISRFSGVLKADQLPVDAASLAVNTDVLDKFTLLGTPPYPYWDIEHFGASTTIDVKGLQGTRSVLQYVSKVLHTVDITENDIREAADPLTTAIGSPAFSSDVVDRLELISMIDNLFLDSADDVVQPSELGISLPSSIADRWISLGERWGVNPKLGIITLIGRRDGPNKKPVTLYDHATQGRELYSVLTCDRLPRARQIFMTPMLLNLAIAPLYWLSKKINESFLPFRSDGSAEGAHRAILNEVDESTLREIDISGMDRNYPESFTNSLVEGLSDHYITPRLSTVVGQQLHQLPLGVRTPPSVGPTQGTTTILKTKRALGRCSGQKITSTFNSLMSLAIQLEALAMAGVTYDDIRDISSDLYLRIQGDDVLVGRRSDGGITSSRYAGYLEAIPHAAAAYGFVVEVFEGRTFLMRHRFPEGDFPVAARIVQQTISPETLPADNELSPWVSLRGRWAYRTVPSLLKSYIITLMTS